MNYKNRGKTVLLHTHIIPSDTTDYTFTPAQTLDLIKDYTEIIMYFHIDPSASAILQTVLNGDSTTHSNRGFHSDQTALTVIDASLALTQIASATLITGANTGVTGWIKWTVGREDDAYRMHSESQAYRTGGGNALEQMYSNEFVGSTITSIKIQLSTGNIKDGSSLEIYGVAR